MNEHRNLLIALALSALVLFGWSLAADRLLPTANPPAQVYRDGEEVVPPRPGADPTADSTTALRSREAVLAETPRVRIRTPKLSGSTNLQGARVDDLVLTRYKETIARDSPPIRLFSPAGAPGAYFASFGWTGGGGLPGQDARWTASAPELTPERPVTLSWTNPAGVRFELLFTVDENYLFTVRQRIANRSGQPVVATPFGLVTRTGVSPDPDSWTAHVGPIGVFNDRVNDIDFDEIAEAPNGMLPFASRGGWLGFSDKYWLAALIPDQGSSIEATMRLGSGERYQLDFARQPQVVGPGHQSDLTNRLFAGAKEVQLLDHYKNELGIPQFDKAIDWGWFYFLLKPIFYLLDWLFRLSGNFGLAIIGLTIIVRTVLFPIANRQFASMAKLRVVQPKMKAIQERYKDDRVRMQQEMMALYQKEKVNPVAGCLPVLLQIPIFYSLYKVLLLAIEMRHQPFVLWIKDLSAPDPLTPVNLFGLLPFQPPQFMAIGVLPLLLGFTMWLQQKLNPQPLDPVQAKVFGIMPWIFMFIMAPFAAGLQLYWTVNNIISIGQQKLLLRRYPVAPAEPVKVK